MKGWRTVVYNGASFITGGAALIFISMDWQAVGASPEVALWIVFGWKLVDNAANFILRFKTNTPVGSK